MNNLKKIGLSALAGSLVAFSAQAGELSVSGGASLTFSNADDKSLTHEGNQWTMGDSITMTGSGDMDNGMSISVSFEIDNDDVGGGNVYDSHSMTLDTNGMGTITFAGHGGSSAMSALDDVTPNAYEESWDIVTGADTNTRVNGSSGDNMFLYTSPEVEGATIKFGYLPSSNSVTDVTYTDFSVAYSPAAVEGLTVGYGMGETEEVTGTAIDDTAMYVTYTYGSVTVGYQENESDGSASSSDIDFTALGISYAVTDDFTVAYNAHESKKGDDADKQEGSGISASYTSGGITVAGAMNDVDNVNFVSTNDTDGYEFNIAFAF